MSNNWRVLRQEPQLRRLLTAGFISGIGDWFNSVAVLSLLLTVTGSGLAVGITLALRVLPNLIFGPIAGIVADRVSRKVILITSDLTRAIFALLFLLVTSAEHVWVVYISTLALVICTTFYTPARTSTLSQVVKPNHLLHANALDQTISGSVMVIGSLIGGVVTAVWGVKTAFIFNSLSFLISAAITMKIRFITPDNDLKSKCSDTPRKLKRELYETRKLFLDSKFVQLMVMLSVLWPIGGGAINVLLSVYAFETFKMGNTGVGIFYASLGVGFIIGGFLAPKFSHNVLSVSAAGYIVEGLSHIFVSQSINIWMASFFLITATIGASVGITGTNTLLMQSIESNHQGKVFGILATLRNSTLGIMMFISGLLLEFLEPRDLGLLAGILITMTTIIIGIMLIRLKLPQMNRQQD